MHISARHSIPSRWGQAQEPKPVRLSGPNPPADSIPQKRCIFYLTNPFKKRRAEGQFLAGAVTVHLGFALYSEELGV